jgi:hypothetical protein
MNKQALKTATVTIAADDTYENLGSAIPQNMRRYVYKIKIIKDSGGAASLITIADRLGTAAETEKDPWYLNTSYETLVDPDELKEDSAPLYIFEGSSSTADRYIRVKSTLLGVIVTIWYCDEP